MILARKTNLGFLALLIGSFDSASAESEGLRLGVMLIGLKPFACWRLRLLRVPRFRSVQFQWRYHTQIFRSSPIGLHVNHGAKLSSSEISVASVPRRCLR